MGRHRLSYVLPTRGEHHPTRDECVGWLQETWPGMHEEQYRNRWSWDDERETMRRLCILYGADGVRAYADAQRDRQLGFDGEPVTERWHVRLAAMVDTVLLGPA